MTKLKFVAAVPLIALAFFGSGLMINTAVASGGFRLILEEKFRKQLSPSQQNAVDDFIRTAEVALPQSMRDGINSTVTVRFEALDNLGVVEPPECLDTPTLQSQLEAEIKAKLTGTKSEKPKAQSPEKIIQGDSKHILGRSYRNSVYINRNFLPEVYLGPDQSRRYDCGHKSMYRLALATLIHEITHIYDSRNAPARLDLKEVADRKSCQSYWNTEPSERIQNPRCDYLGSVRKSVSDRRPYRELMDWNNGVIFKKAKNKLWLRSSDPYEFTNLAESFAVNVEYFLLDPEYRCRVPEVHQFLSDHFGFSPISNGCEVNTNVWLSTTNLPASLNPDRIYQVHFLIAEKGKAFASRWGHAMFRMVVCAPERTEVGPECLQDIGHHVVLSFRANITGITLSYWGGLVGDYPSQLFLYSMPEIVTEYTVGESRDLKSVPLKLSREQIKSLAYRALYTYWAYQGRYYFIGNNCASESLDFTKGALASSMLQNAQPWITTPKKLENILRQNGLLDETVLTAPKARGRYYFPSFYNQVKSAFALIKSQPRTPADLTLDQYIDTYDAEDRLDLYMLLKQDLREITPAKLAVQFLSLETTIRERLLEVLKSRAGKLIDRSAEEGVNQGMAEQFRAALERIVVLRVGFLPWFLVHNGYGIPLATEYRDLNTLSQPLKELSDLTKNLTEQIRTTEIGIFSDLEAVSQNVKIFLDEISKNRKTGEPRP